MRTFLCLLVLLALAVDLPADDEAPSPVAAPEAAPPTPVVVPTALVQVDDGDTVTILWEAGKEIVRLLGIDTPETLNPEHNLPFAQPFGREATGFLRGALALTKEVTLLRSGEKDPYGRTLGYVFLDGKNYSVLIVRARLAVENVSHYGDNGLPEPAKAVRAEAKKAGPVAFEAPHRYRQRMKRVSRYLREQGRYPCPEER